MKREGDWIKLVTLEVVDFIEKKVQVENAELKSALIKDVTKAFERFEEVLFEEGEDKILSEKYESRLDLPVDKWLTRPPGMTIGEWFLSTRTKGGTEDEK